ncbi:DUF7481 family protein [Paraliomyxa miuraensis]|uniref:DUF7481 family protein n=1 Tax=Paraliomyxa miuraensis TaxID=376150 RepID=UPI0022520C81|nr:hypothetical protein [Paraliomyxa miuraensis]MCX4240551.1 hypothetical protein [Paraliomyxa miuraensis]
MTYGPIQSEPARLLLPLLLLTPLACGLPSAGTDTDSSAGTDPSVGTDTDSSAGTDASADGSTTTGEPDHWDDVLEPVPGSRLRPLVRTAEDDTRVQVGWYDTLFETPCAFAHTPNGDLRCLPTTRGSDVWLYADAGCTEPVLQDIWIPEGATVVRESGGCFGSTFHEVGEPVAEIYYNANGPCEFFSNDAAHRVTAIPHDQFVSATVTPLHGNNRIVPLLLQAEDGAQQIFGAWDRDHGEEVVASDDASGQLRWFGRRQPRVSTFYFADASCTDRVAVAECVPDSEQPTTARETEAGYCGALLGRHELLEEVGQIYQLSDGTCQPGSLGGSSSKSWRVGAPLDDTAFAVASTIDDGGARLRHDVYTNSEGAPVLPSQGVRDQLLAEVGCRWRDPVTYSYDPSTTATFDCVPIDAAGLDNRYQDAACTQRRASRWVSEESCPGEALYAYGDGMVAAIDGPAPGGAGYWLDDMDACVPAPPDDGGGFGEYEYYEVDEGALLEVVHAVDVIE